MDQVDFDGGKYLRNRITHADCPFYAAFLTSSDVRNYYGQPGILNSNKSGGIVTSLDILWEVR